MASSSNIGFVAQQQPAVPYGASFAPFCISGTVTTDGVTTGVYSLKDSNGVAIKMPRAGLLISCTLIKTVSNGTQTIKLAKNGTAISSTGGSSSALGVVSGAVAFNVWNSTAIADYSYAVGDAIGLDTNSGTVDAFDLTLWFRPA